MNENLMRKEELMRKLIDLYDQRKYIEIPCTQLLVDSYIRKLELMLKKLL